MGYNEHVGAVQQNSLHSSIPSMLALALAATVHIGVFGSLHPRQLEVSPAPGSGTVVKTQDRREALPGGHKKVLTGPAIVTGRNGTMTKFILGVPGGIHREFWGRLEVRKRGSELLAIVEMDLETAVAAIVAAEGSTAVPFEAKKAQAIATRSYLMGARNRHYEFDFCDSEHCQLLLSPQHAYTAASRAAHETKGMVITYHDSIVPALYSANCGGHTRTMSEAGWYSDNYPFFPVACPRKGPAAGHGVGLCQLGALELAKRGVGYRAILSHYFPHTSIEVLRQPVSPDNPTYAANSMPRVNAKRPQRSLGAPVKLASR